MKMCKKLISVIISATMLLTCCAVSEKAAETIPIVSITFDLATDTAYTVQTGASLIEGRSGKALSSVNINTSFATIDDVSAINSIRGDFTFSIWCYPKDEANWARLYDIGTGTDKYIFLAPSSSFAQGCPRFVIKNGGGEQVLTSNKKLNLNEWNNITVVRQGGLTSMYVNGILSGTTEGITISPSDIGATSQNYLIKSQYSADPYFNGMIDDFLVYNTALTEEEIRKLAAESYTNEIARLVSKYDRYIIETNFYNEANKKIFQINGEKTITAVAAVKNSTNMNGTIIAKLYSYENNKATEIAASEAINISVSDKKEIRLTADIPSGCEYLNLIITDVESGQNFDCGYLGVSNVLFPSPAPADSNSTTYGAHDPTIFKDPVTGKYWAYSTHNLIFESDDLIHWKKHDYTRVISIPAKAKAFIEANYSGTTANTTYWAPDILYVPEDTEHPYWFYVSVSCGLGGRNSVINLLKCKSPGIFDDDYVDCGVVLASKENSSYKTNAIDSNIYTDTNGKRYFVWGSFWQGIMAAELNADGTVKGINYTNDATILSSSQNFGNPLFSVPNGVFGPEGPFMILNTENNYRYLFASYGWLGTNYNIRVARTPLDKTMDSIFTNGSATQFTDHNNNKVGTAYSGQSDKSTLWGYKMIGSYQLGDGIVYYGNGHNSVLNDGNGNWYMVAHLRKVPDATAYLQVRKMLWTEDGWPVVSPLVYSGEEIQAIDETMLYGTWDLSSVGHTILKSGVTNVGSCSSSDADLPVLSSQIVLQPDGKLGYDLGTWQFDQDHTVTITFAQDGDESKYEFYKKGDVLKLYVLTGYDRDKAEHAVVMTGINQNHITQFAKKAHASVADTRPAAKSTTSVSLEKSTSGNPILGFDSQGNIMYAGDPAATVIDDTVYLYAGHDISTDNSYVMPEWVLYTSKDMINWEYKGVVMQASSISWASNSTSAWASQMVEHNGKYYLYFCTWDKTDNGRQSIGVAVADRPEGPFVDKGSPLIKGSVTTPESSTWNDIDPTVWIETVDGVEYRYLAWGNGKYYVCELNDDMISVKDQNGDGIIDMNDIKTQRFINLGSDSFTEAPWLYKRGNTYYTFFAANWREKLAYAKSSSPYGPWIYCGEIMPPTATSNTNHPSVIDFKGKTYLIYHNGALPNGSGYRRSICVEELMFDESGNVLPVTETSTGIAGKMSTITTLEMKYIAHREFTNPSDDAAYPISEQVIINDKEDGLNTAWEIVRAQYEPEREDYISIQSVNKPGLYIAEVDNSIALTQNADGSMTKQMTFKTVVGLNGSGVSFESVSKPGRYLTVIGNIVTLSYGRDADACSFRIGPVSFIPAPTIPAMPPLDNVIPIRPDISNDFNHETARTLIAVSSSEQTPYTGIDGLTMYVGVRASATDSNVAIEPIGTSGNALVINSGRFVSASRGPRIAVNTPVVIENSTVSLTMNVKLSGNGALRYNDSTSNEAGVEVPGLSTSKWSKFKVTLTKTNGEILRTISVNDNVIATDAVEAFPVLWGTTANETYSKVIIDDLSITTSVLDHYSINFVIGDIINISADEHSATVYAAKYNENGQLENIKAYPIEQRGEHTFTAGFEPDKVFIWSDQLQPRTFKVITD